MGLRMKNFDLGIHWKIQLLCVGEFTKNQFNIEWGLPKKRESWTVFRFRGLEGRGGLLVRKRAVLLSGGGGGLIPQCALCIIWY